jgi:hypothetical protein
MHLSSLTIHDKQEAKESYDIEYYLYLYPLNLWEKIYINHTNLKFVSCIYYPFPLL